MVASPVHALDALVPIDDLEDLTDEGAGLLSSILAQGGEQSSGYLLGPGCPFPKTQCEEAHKATHIPIKAFNTLVLRIFPNKMISYQNSYSLGLGPLYRLQ